eukprot:12280699-Ditylum_brightwellii.AAC.1
MKTISKKKGEMGEVNLPEALIISCFEVEDVKVLPPNDIVTQALSPPYVAPKRPVNMAADLLRSQNSHKEL